MADEGKAVTFISSEIDEMLRTCSRMAVLRDGMKVGELSSEEMTQANIMKTIAGGTDMKEDHLKKIRKEGGREKMSGESKTGSVWKRLSHGRLFMPWYAFWLFFWSM
jgi:ABC-type sugar transport system ATPase subunit